MIQSSMKSLLMDHMSCERVRVRKVKTEMKVKGHCIQDMIRVLSPEKLHVT